MYICHAEKVVTDSVWAHRQPALFFHFLQHFLSSRVQSKGFYFALYNRCQLLLSWPCSQIAVSWQPPPSSLHPLLLPSLPACMCSFGFCSIAVKALQRPWAAVAAGLLLPPAALALSLPPPVEAHLLCLAACANVGQGDRLTLILSLAQSWRAHFWNFPRENLHIWGLSALSPAYQ